MFKGKKQKVLEELDGEELERKGEERPAMTQPPLLRDPPRK